MPSIEYSRSTFEIRIVPEEEGGSTIGWTSPDRMVIGRQRILSDATARWLSGHDPLADLPSLQAALIDWGSRLVLTLEEHRLDRVALDIADPALSGISWEYFIGQRIPLVHAGIVRLSHTRSRALTFPLTLPLRMVHLEPLPGSPLRERVLNVFGGSPPGHVELALRIASVAPDAFPPPGWPTVDILHCDALEPFPDPSTLMTVSRPEWLGTLGWFLRVSEQYQMRLIVLHGSTPDEAARARELGAALVRKGGPAVLVGDFPLSRPALGEYEQFYWSLVHDYPLDFALFRPRGLPPVLDERFPALFVGGGREEGLRVSAVGAALVEFKRQLQEEAEKATLKLYVRDLLKSSRRPASTSIEIETRLTDFEIEWDTLRFDLHEHEGFLPVATTLYTVRSNAGVTGPLGWTNVQRIQVPSIPRRSLGRYIRIPKPYARLVRPPRPREPVLRTVRRIARERPVREVVPPPPRKAEPRFLNAGLWREDSRAQLERLAATECLERGRTYQLGAQIGPKDSLLVTIDATALLEEVFKFSPDSSGVWVEIGVTGLDFELLGDPVQELWLPRDAPSDLVYFPIRTEKSRWARLRLCLFYKNTVVQSLRLGVVVTEAADPSPSPQSRGERIAAALGSSRLGAATDAGHAVRLEYSLAVPVSDLEERPERSLTLIANDLDGQPVVTVKGTDTPFATRTNNDLPRHVSAVRDALQAVSFLAVDGVPPDKYPYRFGLGKARNAGTSQELSASLQTIATAGWQLYTATFSPATRQSLTTTLSRKDQIIHVAHVLLEKTIPWAAIYDRRFDPGMTNDEQGAPVLHGVCLAALNPDGSFRATECGPHPDAHADCVLRLANVAKARATPNEPVPHADTIACPLHFWGFRHIIELPPQQVPERKTDARPQVPRIRAGKSAQLVAGVNLSLPAGDEHRTELDGILTAEKVSAVWKAKPTVRDDILHSLKDRDLHTVYLYCHARGGKADPGTFPPYLEFQDTGASGRVTSDLLEVEEDETWRNGPLVMLNGCGTAGFSPDALSPFVITLVQDRGASGVVGTEIAIAEPLAAEAAMTFLTSFLAGTAAGTAMVGMRRSLLAQNNPLGLVYVLYSAADLTVVYD